MMSWYRICAVSAFAVLLAEPASSAPLFEDATSSSGIVSTGRTWSVAWGDVNGDGFPDLWVTRHNSFAVTPGTPSGSLYLNLRGGRFRDATTNRVQTLLRDMHGSAWADYDGDGDEDLAVEHSENHGLTLFRNDDSMLRQSRPSTAFGLPPYSMGRGPLWLDYDADGRLDLYYGADKGAAHFEGGSAVLHQQADGGFEDATATVGVSGGAATAMLSDLTGDGRPELILIRYGAIAAIWETTRTPWRNIRRQLLGGIDIPPFQDIAVGDFDGDLRPDIFLARHGIEDEVVLRDRQVRAYITEHPAQEVSFSFATAGDVTFAFSRDDGVTDYSLIHVGSSGRALAGPTRTSFTLSSGSQANWGIEPHDPTVWGGIYVGWDPAIGRWRVVVDGRDRQYNGFPARGMLISSTASITNLQTEGFARDPQPAPCQLLINTGDGFVDRSLRSRIAQRRIWGNNVATGDFDNDGRLDIYVDQAGPAGNRPNLLLRNLGDGTFERIQDADGAPGSFGGTGGAVAVADWDRDGFLDIALANGGSVPPFNPLNDDGPVQLYHNLGNANHWLAIRLHGVGANTDAIGAKVIVTAGAKRQMREAVNGQHGGIQDDRVLHFGLGENAIAERVQILWPDGEVTALRRVQGDTVVDIEEPAAVEAPRP